MLNDSKPESPDDKVIVAIYRKTRRRISVNAVMKGMTHADYIESIVPPAPEIQTVPEPTEE